MLLLVGTLLIVHHPRISLGIDARVGKRGELHKALGVEWKNRFLPRVETHGNF